MEENIIFDNGRNSRSLRPEVNEAVLIHLGNDFAFYRVSIEGKDFLLKTPVTDNPQLRQILRREYESSLGYDHPNIIRASFFGEVIPGEEGMLLQFEEGRTLGDFLKENPNLATRRKVMRQLLDVVDYLHRHGVVHNDLCPDNILITYADDSLRLLSFGHSDADAHFLAREAGLSHAYSAPELQTDRRSDERSDIYSLGKLMADIFGRRYSRITRKSTEPLPGDRPQTVNELRKTFRMRNNIVWIGAAIAALLLIGAGIVWIVTANHTGEELAEAEISATAEKTKLDHQRLELDSLQISYQQLVDSLRHLNIIYKELRDSVDRAQISEERHKQAVEDRIAEFKDEVDLRMKRALQSLKQYRNASDAARFISMFSDDMENFYRGYPKRVDDEDISPAIHDAYQEAMSRTEEFVKIVSTLPN